MYKVYYVCAVLCVCTLCAKCTCGAGIYVYLQVYMYMCIFVKEYRICVRRCMCCVQVPHNATRAKNEPPNETYMHIPYTIAQCTCTYIACAYILVHSTFYDSTNAKTK